MAKTVSIINEKGGVGKTVTAATMAYLLAKRGYKTLLIDYDGQANSTYYFGIKPEDIKASIFMLLNCLIMDEPLPMDYILESASGVDIIPSIRKDYLFFEKIISGVDFRERKLAEIVTQVRDKYDYIIIDCMARLGVPMINAIMCADEIIVPTQTQLAAIQGLAALVPYINVAQKANHHLKISGVLFTIADKRTRLSKHMIKEVYKSFGQEERIFKSIIPRSIVVPEGYASQSTICEFETDNPAAVAYEAFIAEYLETQEKGGK